MYTGSTHCPIFDFDSADSAVCVRDSSVRKRRRVTTQWLLKRVHTQNQHMLVVSTYPHDLCTSIISSRSKRSGVEWRRLAAVAAAAHARPPRISGQRRNRPCQSPQRVQEGVTSKVQTKLRQTGERQREGEKGRKPPTPALSLRGSIQWTLARALHKAEPRQHESALFSLQRV